MPFASTALRARWLRLARALLLGFALVTMGLALANHDHDRLPPGQAGCAVCLHGTASTPPPAEWHPPELPVLRHAPPISATPTLAGRLPAGTLHNRGPPRPA